MTGLCIKSDFTDYYDNLSDSGASIVYNRFYSECHQRGAALNLLRNYGIKTIDIKPVSSFLSSEGKIVVYTNPKLHSGMGKRIMTVDEALQSYENCPASKYHDECEQFIKMLQVGKHRFMLTYKRNDSSSLTDNTLINFVKMSSDYNRIIGLPIFSIDYICYNNEMVATDFNEVENISKYSDVKNTLTPEQVVSEVKASLIKYNKA